MLGDVRLAGWTQAGEPRRATDRFESNRGEIRDRIRLVKNEHYWNRDVVKLEHVDVLAVEGIDDDAQHVSDRRKPIGSPTCRRPWRRS